MGNPTQYGMQELFEESVSAVTATNSVQLGARRFDAGADWIYCYNASSNQAINVGRGVRLMSGSTGYSVDVANIAIATTTAGIFLGACVNATIPTGYYGWLMTRGFANVEAKLCAPAKGEAVFFGTSGVFHAATALTAGQARACLAGICCDDNAATTTATASFTAYICSPIV